MERLILDSNVILCTLSMMLNPKLRSNGTFSIVPPRCLVIDEASQINAFEFMVIRILHLQNPDVTFHFPTAGVWRIPKGYRENLLLRRSLATYNDISLLLTESSSFYLVPPFGHDDVPEMKTIFDFEHLNGKEDTYFLNIQCMSTFATHIMDNIKVSIQIECQIPLRNSSHTMSMGVTYYRSTASLTLTLLLLLTFLVRASKAMELVPRYNFFYS